MPLEQFEIEPILASAGYTNLAHAMFAGSAVCLFILVIGAYRAVLVSVSPQSLSESLYLFVLGILRQQAGTNSIKHFPVMASLFLFILSSNLVGLVPESLTPTAQIGLTFTLSLSHAFGCLLVALAAYGLSFLWLFVPSGVPSLLLPLILVIEVVSYALRPVSLAIRLFANMMAGHTLLHILGGFVSALSKPVSIVVGLPFYPLLFLLTSTLFFALALLTGAVFLLEVAIALLQAYVFTVLAAIYLRDSITVPSH